MATKKTTPKKSATKTKKPASKKPATKKKATAPKEHVHDASCGHNIAAVAKVEVPTVKVDLLVPQKKKSLWKRIVGFGF